MKYDFRKLKTARESRLLTRTEVAKLAGVSHATVGMVESGRAPWLKAIRKIAAALEVPVKSIVIQRKSA